MPVLDFKGKHHIYAHHLSVPYRPLVKDENKSCHSTDSDDNLVIHGDNLHALKALLPRYANRVKCIYIDPPYNTGSQDWVYNDKVNSPLMQEWFKENSPVDNEDLEKHDKWLCMMWPRLHLLRELLSEAGVIFVSVDDHEQWRLLGILEEIFGERNFIGTLIYVQNLAALPGKWMTQVTEYIHVFAKEVSHVSLARLPIDEDNDSSEWLRDEKGYYKKGYGLVKTGPGAKREDRPELYFPIYVGEDRSISLCRRSPNDTELFPTHSDETEARWRWSRERVENNRHNLIVESHRRTTYQLITKVRPSIGDTFDSKPRSLWYKPEYAAANGTNIMKALMGERRVFDFPKPVPLIADLIRFANVSPDDIVLDSFAGSGTTAHATLTLNKEDGGNRKFILIECEDYADTITAERVRRVINGVETATNETIRNGLGGSFAYCTLGDPIEIERMLTGETLPSYTTLASNLLFTASGANVEDSPLEPKNEDGLFYSDEKNDYYLLYESDLNYLRSNEAILTKEQAVRIRDVSLANGRKAIVYAAGNYLGQRELTKMGIMFSQLPHALHEK